MHPPQQSPPLSTLQDSLAKARSILGESRALIREAFAKDFSVQRKADQTWVTEIDLAVEQLLRSRLQEQFPGYGIIGEEFAGQNRVAPFTWVVDPIDGTSSLRHRIPLFGTILALLQDGKPVLGLIDLPLLDRLYHGGAGLGAWRNEHRLQIADPADSEITSEVISVASRGQYVSAGMTDAFDKLMQLHPDVRTYGDCFGHGMVLEGSVGALTDFGLRVWDVSATEVLVQEAGGKFFCWRTRGELLAEKRYDVIFGKPRVVDWIVRTLKLA
ncbi:MAG TPA: inositol monophosphatase [Terriglobia bacterium]|nr:inositol monophosphatase [Terriglobia bacterium]